MEIWSDLQEELERYRSSTSIINQYLNVYEEECRVLIEKIHASSSFEDAGRYFDSLHEIQRRLSIVKYKFEFPLKGSLRDLIYHLDRDDIYSRRHWYGEFKKGLKWPDD